MDIELWLYADHEERPRLLMIVEEPTKINKKLVARFMEKDPVNEHWLVKLRTGDYSYNRMFSKMELEYKKEDLVHIVTYHLDRMIEKFIHEVGDTNAQRTDTRDT